MGRLAQDLLTLPNAITTGRIVLIYACIGVWLLGHQVIALSFGFLAGIGDYLDGWLARRTGKANDIGGMLDQLSDLIFESTTILFGIYMGGFPVWVAPVYLLREWVILSARNLALAKGWTLRSGFVGKLKTNFLHYAVFVLFIGLADVCPPALAAFLRPLALFGVVAGLVLSYVSGGLYLAQLVRLYEGDEGDRPVV